MNSISNMLTRTLPLILLASLAMAGCHIVEGSGEHGTELRKVEVFGEIDIDGAIKADLVIKAIEGDKVGITICGDDNLLEFVETTVEDGTLHIDTEEGVSLITTMPLVVYAAVPDLTGIQIDGSGDVRVRGLDNEGISVDIDGSGNIYLYGVTELLDVNIDGSGAIYARDLDALDATVSIDGSGDLELCVYQALSVEIDGSGDVDYWCDPVEVDKDINGSGDLTAR